MKTKIFTLTAIALLLTIASAFATQPETVQGEYLEARSVSVYVGACHYGAEYVEGGREATLVWNIRQGTWKGVSLEGLTVVAVVTAQNNLAIDTSTRRSVLYLDEKTTSEQRTALIDLMTTKRSELLGEVISTESAPITFAKEDVKYDLRVGEVLTLSVSRYPCQNCTQPHQIWYKPLEQLDTPIVGKSTSYCYQDKILSVTWNCDEDTNNVFVGNFAM